MKKNRFSYPFVALTAVLCLVIGFHTGGYQLAVSEASATFGLDKTGMGALAAVQFSSMICVPLLFGLLADRIGKKPVLLIGMASALFGSVLAGLSGSLIPYAAGVFCIGGGSIICEGLTSAVISDMYPEKSAQFITLGQCFFSIGSISGPLVLQFCMDRGVYWKILYAIYGVAFLLCLPLLLRTKIAAHAPGMPKPRLGNPLKILLKPTFFMLFIAMILYVGLETGFAFFIKSLFDLRLDAGHMGAYALSAFWFGNVVARLLYSVRSVSTIRAGTISFFAAAGLLAALALTSGAVAGIVISAAAGFAYGPIWSGIMALGTAEAPGQTAGAAGLMSTGCGIGGVLYPIAMGIMADRVDMQVPFILLAFTALAGGGLLLWYSRQRARMTARR